MGLYIIYHISKKTPKHYSIFEFYFSLNFNIYHQIYPIIEKGNGM